MKDSVEMFFFSVFNPKYLFWGHICSKKIKIVCWGSTLESILIRICRIRWRFSFLSFLDQKYRWVDLNQKLKIFSLSSNVLTSMLDVHFFCYRPFFASFFSNISMWHFDVTWLISQQFTRRDLKPVASLVVMFILLFIIVNIAPLGKKAVTE